MSASPASRPNILLLQADQHRADCLGVAGHPVVRTPYLDRLAGEGVYCPRAFTPTPVCVPARTSLLHGCWPSRHGCIVNESLGVPHLDTSTQPSFPAVLRRAGYRLAHVGKWQVSAGTPPAAFGYDPVVPPAAYARWRQAQGLPPVPRRNRWFGEVDEGVLPEQSRLAWEADATIRLLRQAVAAGGPFLLHWDISEPHLPNVVPEPFASMYRPESLSPWPGFADTLAGKPYIQGQQRRSWRVDGWPWERWAPIVARYLGEISLLDRQVGRVLEALEDSGAARDTLVVYTSDHGDLCGSHGMIDKHYVMYDDLVRVPLILRWPGGRNGAGIAGDAFVVHGLDLAWTFCELACGQVPETFQGASLRPLLTGEGDTGRQDVVAVYYGNQFGLYTQRMVRERSWKLVWNATAEDELYHLDTDPGELHNRARDPKCAAELKRLRARLVEWMEATGDQQLNGWVRDQLLNGLSL